MFILSGCQKVNIVNGVMDEGQECYEIRLENATLYYQKTARAFSSNIDKNGRDWMLRFTSFLPAVMRLHKLYS
jgi:hypothetical protein